jgi:hypothetical protein
MFPGTYFAATYFAAAYFPKGVEIAVPVPDPFAGRVFRVRQAAAGDLFRGTAGSTTEVFR